MILQSKDLYDWLAALLPLGGIALSWWSFRFAEDGATPDTWTDIGSSIDIEQESLQKGMRYRARLSARALFAAGALLVAAAVPMGAAATHVQERVNFSAIAGFLIIAFSAGYIVMQAIKIWRDRRRDAFGLYYSKDMFSWYDESKTAELYYALNPMPFWSLLDRNWFASRKRPNIDDVFANAAKTASPQDTPPLNPT
ncbi:MAG TPA: hypothetical protein VGU66_18855 [Candidatus Elarobacter sp.]|nr:hypothetical protein [Candidatus Elarobacter sp.]